MKANLRYLISGLLFLILLLLLLMSTCKKGELKDQVTALENDKIVLSNQKDTLNQLLNESRMLYDTLATSYDDLSEEKEALEAKVRSLQSRLSSMQTAYNTQGAQLKEAEAEKTMMNNIITRQNDEKDSITHEIVLLNSHITDLKDSLSDGQAENKTLTDIIKIKESRITEDSLAEAERLSAPKENGFVDIISVTGGYGLKLRDLDYEKHLIAIDNVFGYQINRNFLAGIGTGIHLYDGGELIPLFLDFRYRFGKGSFKPFLSADGGFLLCLEDFEESNTFIQPMIGLSRRLGQKTYLYLSTGLTIIQTPPPYHRSTFFSVKAAFSIPGKNGPEI